MKTQLLSLLLCIFLFSCSSTKPQLQSYDFTEKHMGTDFRIILYANNAEEAQYAAKKAFERIKNIDQSCSDYIAESELNKLSRTHDEWIPISDDLWNVLSYAQKLAEQSQGAFDITCGPLSLQWRLARFRKKLPSQTILKRALTRVGYNKLTLKPETQSVKLSHLGMKLDLGALAKGYAADQALLKLKTLGIQYVLIDASGDMLMTDHPSSYWKVHINDSNQSKASSYVKLQAGAIATSGDAIQNLSLAETKYSHIIDPRSGQALTQSERVTIISKTAMQADALASVSSVLKHSKAIPFLKQFDHAKAAFYDGKTTHLTHNFPSLYKTETSYD